MKVRRNLLQTALIMMIITQLLSAVIRVSGQPVPIGTTVQTNPFESNPTAGATSGVVGISGTEANARDGDFASNVNWRIGGALSSVTAYVEMTPFNNAPSASFTIGWVDIKINYRATATADDKYRIAYQVGSSANVTLQDWISGTAARFDNNGAQDERAWSNVAEPNDGVWDWTDVGNIKVRVETQRVGAEEAITNRFYLHEVWLSVYGGSYPVGAPSVLRSHGVLDKYFDADSNDVWGVGEPAVRDVNSDGVFQGGSDILLIGSPPSSGSILKVPGALDKHHDANGDNIWSVDEPAIRDMNDNGVFDAGTDIVLVGSAPGAVSIQPSVVGGLIAGDTFFVDVFVTNVDHLFGPFFFIFYNTTVLTAFDYFFYNPFIFLLPSEINDDPYGNGTGYVSVSQSSFLGDSVGFSGSGPVLRIYFFVDMDGTSLLHFQNSLLSTTNPTVYGSIAHTASDGVFATNPVRDVAVTDVSVNATQVMPGTGVAIDVTVANQGTIPESSINVTVYFNSTAIIPSQVIPLGAASSTTLRFNWDTTGVPIGHYQVRAEATTTPPPDESDLTDNTRSLPGIVIIGRHDVAITEVLRAYPTRDVAIPANVFLNVTQGEKIYINVTAVNQGTFTETFNVTALFYNGDDPSGNLLKTIGNQTGIVLGSGSSAVLNFTWDTTVVKFKSPTYSTRLKKWLYYNNTQCVPRARATFVPFEANTTNNELIDGTVNVTISTPTVSFIPNLIEVWVGQPVTFDASATTTTAVTYLTQFRWDFDDGTVETYVKNVNLTLPHKTTHSFLAAGEYSVLLIAWNNLNFNNTYVHTQNITVYIRDVAILSVIPAATTGVTGQFLNVSVTVKNEGGNNENRIDVTLYRNDTSIMTLQILGLGAGANSTVVFSWNTTGLARGVYIIKAVAAVLPVTGTETYETDTADNTFTYSGTVSMFNAPTVSFSFAPAKPFVTQPVAFDASGSSDLDGTIASYKWDFGDSNTTTVTSSIVRHAYAAKGKYTVNLTVTDNEGFARSMVQNVTVYIRDLAVFSVEASPTSVTAGDMVTISVTVRNEGESADSFEVAVMGGRDGGSDEDIDFANVTNLAPGGFTTVTFNWDTSGWGAGAYTVKGSADSNYDSDLSDNLGVGSVVNVAAATNWLLYGAVAAVVGVAVALGLLYFFKFRKK